MTILDEIYKHKLSEVAENKKRISVETLKEQIKERQSTRSFGAALKSDTNIRIIAEIKRRLRLWVLSGKILILPKLPVFMRLVALQPSQSSRTKNSSRAACFI